MSEISEAAKAKADNLLVGFEVSYLVRDTFARFIQQVSDAVKAVDPATSSIDDFTRILDPFILPEPVDPLVDALEEARYEQGEFPDNLREALAKRGLKIVPVQS